jgi:hypothetical protein
MMFKGVTLLAVLAVSVAPALHAQDTNGLGFVIQTPANLGVSWSASPKVSLRPDVNFTRSTSSSSGVSNTATLWTVGLSVPIALSDADNLRTYFSPRYSYSSTKFTSPAGTSTSQPTHAFSVSYGAEWTAMKRLHFFGEVGPQYTRVSSSSVDNHGYGLRSSLGLILY